MLGTNPVHSDRHPWKSGFLICVLIFILIFTDRALANSSADDDIHISAIAEFYALHTYPQLKGHKAFAVGPGGYWMDSFGKPSAKAAAQAALKSCTAGLRTSPYKSLANRECVLFDLDGKRTGKATPIGIPFGAAAEGPDLPYENGNRWQPSRTPHRGILLLLHGCNKLDYLNGFVTSWVNFYRANGFWVVLPDSFAEKRDSEVCGLPGEHGIDSQTRNLKLRIAQTLRTLATLRQKYPGEPIYIHGHSEGGYVAQALGEKVAGIITTGALCGFVNTQTSWVAEGTPLLVIVGTKDPYVTNDAHNAKELSSYCKKVSGAGKLTTVSVPRMGHYAAVWRASVRDAISKFLEIEPIAVARTKYDGLAFPKVPLDILEEYRKAANPKAIAADGNGALSWYWTAESQLDAEEMALFDCDHKAGADPFFDPSHEHACALVDVNGKRIVK